ITQLQRIFPEALEKEEFKVFYQPKIDINTGELIGAEALCRWFRDGKIVPPLDFIPILEQGHDICKLDFYMLDHVCRDIRRWLDEGRQVVRVSVNLSRKHMVDYDLLEHIMEVIDKNKVPHKYIEIELTETTTDVEFRDLKRVVNGLQRAGVSTSVDDFGMGYSSLNLIKEIPWNVLKVDKSFLPVDEDNENSTRSIMFKYVIAMAKEMGLECIAEGVETQDQVDVLRDNHCDLAQGFFFDKPLPVGEFEDRMTLHRYSMKN
ncbi:MAG: EAL domain-containing protein, partial [Ruminococcus sp.]|nr:EAL domain-containing protein [Ruminococcus sp.]